jgi:hypothetical protein
MLEAIAIAALVMGGVSAVTLEYGDVAAEDAKSAIVEEMQTVPTTTAQVGNPFLD